MENKIIPSTSLEDRTIQQHFSANNAIQQHLLEIQEPTYKEFHMKLMPTIHPDTILGIRIPKLRAYAKELYKAWHKDISPEVAEDCPAIQLQSLRNAPITTNILDDFLTALPHTYYEENNLHAFTIEQYTDYEQCINAVDAFLPYIDNWATCDSLRPKIFKKHKAELLTKINEWLVSQHPYTVRFAIEMLLVHYLDDDFSHEYLSLVASVSSEEYYVKMMVAWYFATALAKQYDASLPYLERKCLEPWTHNKTIQKAIESYRITEEQKKYLRNLKI